MLPAAALEVARHHFPVLGALTAEQRDELAATSDVLRIPDRAEVFDVGSPCRAFALVTSGVIRVSVASTAGREVVLYRVRPGESCTVTASCVVAGSPYPARGTAEGEVLAVGVPVPLFRRLVDHNPAVRGYLLEHFSSRVAQLTELVTAVVFHRLDARLADRLLELGPDVRRSHQELADELGSTREMVSRLLESLADDGLVELARRHVRVLAPDDLRARFASTVK
jgi:CRP/FNR family transcriptional regulator